MISCAEDLAHWWAWTELFNGFITVWLKMMDASLSKDGMTEERGNFLKGGSNWAFACLAHRWLMVVFAGMIWTLSWSRLRWA